MRIVKLGGSLEGSPRLRAWLCAIAERGGPCIVVPGGGRFADGVRQAQRDLGFGEQAAHRMAILAMQQYGLLLQELEPRLGLAETSVELCRGDPVIWLPWHLAGLDQSMPQSWTMTSDSLALWLAIRLHARSLLLVKASTDLDGDLASLAERGVVDPLVPQLARGFGGRIMLRHEASIDLGG